MSNVSLTWREQLGPLRFLAAKVARAHGQTHPDMATLNEVISILANSPADDLTGQRALASRVRVLTGDFQPWDGACGSVQQLFTGLAAVVALISPDNEGSPS